MVWERLTAPDRYFYPRPPRGERRCGLAKSALPRVISIHALREEGDLTQCCQPWVVVGISIHALREESDWVLHRKNRSRKKFLSTPSARRATKLWGRSCRFHLISIHALREESDLLHLFIQPSRPLFLSTPSARRATAKTERKHPAFVSLYTSLHKLQRDVCKPTRKITSLLAQTAGIPVRSVPGNHVCCRFALARHQKISTLSWANSGCSPMCSTLVW